MQLLNKGQLIAINTLISKLQFTKEQKATMVSGFTAGRSGSSKDLLMSEAALLISHLKRLDPDEKQAEKMRRKIISMAHELHWHKPGTVQIDMKRVDGWCKSYGFGKKGLNSYALAELPKLVTQFEKGPYSHFISR